ncbi:hypothetical protein JNB71_15545 [Rhizobium herbae]|uniref:Uncharacterized protein n=1 Tax=Rhizobium herbae TaxID=508661 RepID=A0ABS7HC76_9HYPH|nr:hypothetical protein [Rhizobium herbae]MBW9064729.1 hypothetical protein [Rhizobium herbae]
MSKVVVIGFPGDPTLYVADIDAGTVTPLNTVTGALASANQLRASGGVVVKDVDFAVAISSASSVSAGLFDT